jgi:hypothetical protein
MKKYEKGIKCRLYSSAGIIISNQSLLISEVELLIDVKYRELCPVKQEGQNVMLELCPGQFSSLAPSLRL